MNRCYLCGSSRLVLRNDKTRDMSSLKVRHCSKCSLTFLHSFNHLANISYEKGDMYESKISTKKDYQIILDNVYHDDSRRFSQWKKIIKNKTILDFGSGAGGFLKLALPVAKKVYGVELDSISQFYTNKIEVKKHIEDFDIKFDVITLFHVLEHIEDPIGLLKKLRNYLNVGGKIIIEVPNDNDALISYYNLQSFKNFTYWSLHLYSYNKKTLDKICKRAGFKKTIIDFFQRYSLANHVGWLKDGRPGGQNVYKELNEMNLNDCYEEQLKKINACDTLIAVLRK